MNTDHLPVPHKSPWEQTPTGKSREAIPTMSREDGCLKCPLVPSWTWLGLQKSALFREPYSFPMEASVLWRCWNTEVGSVKRAEGSSQHCSWRQQSQHIPAGSQLRAEREKVYVYLVQCGCREHHDALQPGGGQRKCVKTTHSRMRVTSRVFQKDARHSRREKQT